MNRSPGLFFMDEYGVFEDDVEMTFSALKRASHSWFWTVNEMMLF